MNLRNVLRRFGTGGNTHTDEAYLLSVRHMSDLLERERLRADRSCGTFALATFETSERDVDELSRVLSARLRRTDVAGRMRRDVVGVFLPDTPEEGAWKVIHDVNGLLPASIAKPKCDVYVYPYPWWPEDSDKRPRVETEVEVAVGNGHASNGHARENGHGTWESSGNEVKTERVSTVDANAKTDSARAVPMQALFARPLPLWKRSMDLAGAVCGLALCSPILVLAAVAVKATSPGPILFQQRRAGLGGRTFTMWKFRTMCDAAEHRKHEVLHLNEQDGAAFKIKDDPRITRVGKFLRKTSIDELPQLWNVLRGDMTLVGPRPLPVDEANACEPWQRRRLDVTPGLTCTWQVFGRSRVSFEEWMRMDLQYADHVSWSGDAKLLLQTVPAVLARRGAR